MKLKTSIIAIALLSRAVIAHADEPLKTDTREPYAKVSIEQYCFGWDYFDTNSNKTKYFIFAWDKTDGYSIQGIGKSDYITKGTHYIKTFGGAPPTVFIDVINNRFIAFPETIKGSEDASKMFYPMKAITRVYDIKTGKIVLKSEPYTYDHNIPLVYDLRELSFLSKEP